MLRCLDGPSPQSYFWSYPKMNFTHTHKKTFASSMVVFQHMNTCVWDNPATERQRAWPSPQMIGRQLSSTDLCIWVETKSPRHCGGSNDTASQRLQNALSCSWEVGGWLLCVHVFVWICMYVCGFVHACVRVHVCGICMHAYMCVLNCLQ